MLLATLRDADAQVSGPPFREVECLVLPRGREGWKGNSRLTLSRGRSQGLAVLSLRAGWTLPTTDVPLAPEDASCMH